MLIASKIIFYWAVGSGCSGSGFLANPIADRIAEVDPVTKTNTMRKISLVSDSLFLTIQRKEVDLANCQQ